MYLLRCTALIVLAVVMIGCGGGSGGGNGNGGGSGGGSQAISVSVAPQAPTVAPGAGHTFTATVTSTSNTAVTWAIEEGQTGGTVTASGVYAAPALAGTYHVRATSVADPSKCAVAVVTVPVTVSISAPSSTATIGDTIPFSAVVRGARDTSVTWSVVEGAGGGAITAAGVYTPPSGAGTYHIKAVSVADPNRSATAVVTVQVAGGIITIN